MGRQFDDPDVQRELSLAPFRATKMPGGGVGIIVTYNDEEKVISAEHFMAMMLVKAKDIGAKANGGINIADSVLAVPHWFTESQRRGILNACEIAGINCLKVTNESNAIALSYGIFKSAKKLFSETDPTHVMFVDIGYTGYSVTIVDFIQENMRVLSTVCDRELGGRDFDNIIIEFLAETFESKTKINVRKNIKAILKLQAAAEKAKKTLSPNGVNEANISVECLAEDIDLNAILTKEEFEKRAAPLIARLRPPIEQALKEANLTKEQLSETEILGGSSRIGIIKRTLGEILGLDPTAMNYGLKTTMNADEAVARGGALQCAMLSSRMKVKPFNIVDKIPYGIVAHFEGSTAVSSADDASADEQSKGTSVTLYSRNGDLPHKPRRLTFHNKSSDFTITVAYDDAAAAMLPRGESRFLGKYKIKVPPTSPAINDVRVTWNLDKNGFVYVQSAQLLEEVKLTAEEEQAAEKEAKEKDAKEKDDGNSGSAGSKRRFKKTDLEVVVEHPGLSKEQIKAAIDLETDMANEDRLITETADKRNELEAYIYGMRDKLDGVLKTYTAPAEKGSLVKLLDAAEDWLYNDGFDCSKQHYAKKIEELRAVGNPIEYRYSETLNRPAAIAEFKKQIELCKGFASKYDESNAHVTEDERDKLRKEIQSAENWLYDNIAKQGDQPSHANPVLTCESISVRRKALFQVSNPIVTKPKPKPVVVEPPSPPPQPEQQQQPEPMDQSQVR